MISKMSPLPPLTPAQDAAMKPILRGHRNQNCAKTSPLLEKTSQNPAEFAAAPSPTPSGGSKIPFRYLLVHSGTLWYILVRSGGLPRFIRPGNNPTASIGKPTT
jgi:hypothetical protein